MSGLGRIVIAALIVAFLGAAMAEPSPEAATPPPSLEPIADDVWIHKSYATVEPWGPILSQGMVVKTDAGVVLVDTAWNDEDTMRLLELINAETGEAPRKAIVTHAHNDKMGGMAALIAAGVKTEAHALTNADAPARGLTPAGRSISQKDVSLLMTRSGGTTAHELWILYPGPGHTRDNIVVYYAPAKVLFGGCLIRPANATNLGNTADGDVENWANAVRAVAERFPEAEIVIPSHGEKGGRELLDHTIALAEAAAANAE